ncbi:MAG: DUF971 domain-containing protein [Burkholderiales bacterium]|nr:DUF971 domain-containing protein [Nitrosomonas sp.]MCP5273548.1 DUF971 domain-containing protein [Burkholderiales bacterium]
MAGLSKNAPVPTEIKFHKKSRILDITFSDGKKFQFSCEFLRVHSPSAEVSGHSPGQEILQTGKKNVNILKIDPVGHYAIQPFFSDGHNTGLYSWDLLYKYGLNQDKMWQDYLERLKEANATRESDTDNNTASHRGCQHH